jgi:hypothetical protein
MSPSGKQRGNRHPASRIALGGAILGGISVAVGVLIMAPIANHSASDDSPSSQATILLVFFGLVIVILSAALYAGAALWRWRRGQHTPSL